MLSKEVLLEAFRQLTDCCYQIWNWKLDTEWNVVESDCPKEAWYKELFFADGRDEAVMEQMGKSPMPVVSTVSGIFSWIIAFERTGDTISGIHIKGPFFNGFNDQKSYPDIVKPLSLTQAEETAMASSLRTLPMLTSSSIMQLAVMLHYSLNNEKILISDIGIYNSETYNKRDPEKVLFDQFHGLGRYWDIEEEILHKVRSGELDYGEVIGRATVLMSGIYENDKKSIEFYKQNIHNLLTLVSRAATQGGLSRKTSMSICADYRRKLNKCPSMSAMVALSNEALEDFTLRVHTMKRSMACSSQIRICCEYIDSHPEDKLTLELLAKKAGYTEHHLSRKFGQEMNCSITDYINKSKIERAKFMLLNTNLSVQGISEKLGFDSRSYFTYTFRRFTGETPSDYRKENQLI